MEEEEIKLIITPISNILLILKRFLLIDKIYTMKTVEIAPKNPESGSMYNPKTMFRLKTMVIRMILIKIYSKYLIQIP